MPSYKNKLTIYLLKGDIANDFDAVTEKNPPWLNRNIPNVGTFYYAESEPRTPEWVNSFFRNTLQGVENLTTSTAKGVLITSITYDGAEVYFGLCFGYGRYILDLSKVQAQFGLKVMLNIVDNDQIRKIDKKQLSAIPKDTSEQLSRAGLTSDFGIDIEQDMLRAVTGATKPEHMMFGKTPSGKDALSLSVQRDVENLDEFLQAVYERYRSEDYKESFSWVDQIKEVTDRAILDELEVQLIERIKDGQGGPTLWMAVPDIVRWESLRGFRYSNDPAGDDDNNDLSLDEYLSFYSEEEIQQLGIERLRSDRVFALSEENDGEIMNAWKAYNCLYCEAQLEEDGSTYMLSNGIWYEVHRDFSTQIRADFNEFRESSNTIDLPDFNPDEHTNENGYNTSVAKAHEGWVCLDAENIQYGGGHSKIEFCDILTSNNELVHVKHYGGSSVLSHLFAQGSVSGNLFKSDPKFVKKVQEKLGNDHQLGNANDYKVVYAVISERDGVLQLPFFSMVNLRNHKRILEAYGYEVSIQKINHLDAD